MYNDITDKIIKSAIEIHRELGPGLLEKVYHTCLLYELKQQGLTVNSDVELPVMYKNVNVNCRLRIDLVVENRVLVELKCAPALLPIHKAQLIVKRKWFSTL